MIHLSEAKVTFLCSCCTVLSCSLLSSSRCVFVFHSSSVCLLSSFSFSFNSLCSWFSRAILLCQKQREGNAELPVMMGAERHGCFHGDPTQAREILEGHGESLTAASFYLHVLQSRQQRLVGLTHLLLASPHIFQGLLNVLPFSLRNVHGSESPGGGGTGHMLALALFLTSSCFALCSKSLSVVLSSWTA